MIRTTFVAIAVCISAAPSAVMSQQQAARPHASIRQVEWRPTGTLLRPSMQPELMRSLRDQCTQTPTSA